MNEFNMETRYIPTKTARKILGVTAQTLRNWDNSGKVRSSRTPSGLRLFNLEDIQNISDIHPVVSLKEKICYCRVSSKKQLDDLERQENFFRTNYPNYKLVSDVGSGLNWKRKGFQTILDRAMSGDINEVVVAHRDRLCRFAFELVEYILQKRGVKLVVLDKEDNKSGYDEITKDILSIIHVYSCKEMGRRRYTKNKKNSDISGCEPEKDTESVDGDE